MGICVFTWFWTGALDMVGGDDLGCLLRVDVMIGLVWMQMVVRFVL